MTGSNYPKQTLDDWQSIVDTIVRITGVKVGLIMELVDDDIAVLVASRTEGNPYHVGEREHFEGSGLYCEGAIKNGTCLQVSDALNDPLWNANPDLKFGLIAYLGMPIKLPDQRILGTICILDDEKNQFSPDVVSLMRKMCDLIESQLSVLEREERLERVLSATGLGTWEWKWQSNMIHLDRRAASVIGRSAVDHVIHSEEWHDQVHPDDQSDVKARLMLHLSGESPAFDAEYRRRGPDGQWIWVHDQGKIVRRDKEDKPTLITGIIQDVTNKKQIERESSNLLHRLEKLMQAATRPSVVTPDEDHERDTRNLEKLTRRQRQILCLVANGLSSAEIAQKINISKETVNTHRRDLMQKLNIRSVAGLTRIAVRAKIV